ncbi:MAG TPA: acyltransferase [Acidobacteriaceae bacterium]|nr:acyltransferase [Acidobacteriaceae bacterium]
MTLAWSTTAAQIKVSLCTMASTGSFYKPELDVLRFCAFLMVFAFHIHGVFPNRLAFLPEAGDAGVQVFFVLSSYLIGELLLREREATGRVHLKKFYFRRVLRIWPVYFAIVFGAFGYSLLSGDGSFTPHALAAFVCLGGNLYIAAAGYGIPDVLAALWTISIEEQFYLLAPFVWSRGSKRGAMVFSLLTIAGAYLILVLHFFHGGDDQHVWYSSLVQFQYFGFGMLLALVLHGRTISLRRWMRAGLLLLAGTCFTSSQSVFHLRTFPAGWHTCAGYLSLGIGACSVLVAFLGWNRLAQRRWLIYLGRISYGLYAYHLLAKGILDRASASFAPRVVALPHGYWIFEYAFFITTLGATICLAALSYRFLELPFLRLKQRVGFVRSQPVSVEPAVSDFRNLELNTGN